MRIPRLMPYLIVFLALLAVMACGRQRLIGTGHEPLVNGDACALLTTQQACTADTQDGCQWMLGPMCPMYMYPDGGTGGCTGGGECMNPNRPALCGDGGTVSGGTAGGAYPDGGSYGDGGSAPTNPCAQYTSQTSCQADTADSCYWFAMACPVYMYPDGGTGGCTGGSCVQQTYSGSSCSGSGSARAACACAVSSTGPAGPEVCVEQGTSGTNVSVLCVLAPTTCANADPCTCISGAGSCTSSPDVLGLCICH